MSTELNPSTPRQTWALSGRALWLGTGAVFLAALAFFAFLYLPSPLIYDADSYYHLAIARAYGEQGVFERLEGVRFGLLSERFGDKEFLFHGVIVPFTAWMDPQVGGRIALALLGAWVLSVIGFLSLRAIGPWGVLVPFWLAVGSLEFTWRLVRLRPELASLAILLLALWAVVRRRYVLLGLLSLVYALTYTAIHAFLGIFGLVFLGHLWAYRRFDWRLLLFPVVGAGLGLALHPQFPDNLVVWWFQSIEYFRFRGSLDVGTEIEPPQVGIALLVNLGWLLGMAILWRSRRIGASPRSGRAALTFTVAAVAFGLLYAMMSRFALYFVPLATLALLFEIRRLGGGISTHVRLPLRGTLRTSWAWALCLLVCLPVAGYELSRYRQRNSPGPEGIRRSDRVEFAARLPAGARVANPWRSTPIYMFWAPQGRYLNVLDPVFLAAWDPDRHQVQDAIFSGTEPDVPWKAAVALDSQFVAFSAATGNATLQQRLAADPRIRALYRGINLLFEVRAPERSPFILDWQVVPAEVPLPPPAEIDGSTWAPYPISPSGEARALEGYVDALRVVQGGECVGLTRSFEVSDGELRHLEFAPSGPSKIWIDADLFAEMPTSPGAVLGRGAIFPLRLSAGTHRMSVLSCPDRNSSSVGFYLVERQPG